MEILIPILFIALTCVVIWRASDGFEVASEYLGRNLSEGVRGATINAIGSSMPELFTTIFFLFVLKDKDGFSGGIGTTAGSAVFNSVIIPASVILVVTAYGLADKIRISRKVILRDGISLIFAELVLILFIGGPTLDWWQGLILMSVYGMYVAYMLTSMRKNQNKAASSHVESDTEAEEEHPASRGNLRNQFISMVTLDLEPVVIRGPMNTLNSWILLLLSMAVIGGACFLLVDSCERLGHAMGIPIYFVAVVLASAATSVPDTILSVRDAVKGNYDDAVSNAIGSNVFDICFALGLPLFLFTLIYGPLSMSQETLDDVSQLLILLLGLTVLAVFVFYVGDGMGKGKAVVLLGIYIVFLVYILGDKDVFGYSNDISHYLQNINESLNGLRFWLN